MTDRGVACAQIGLAFAFVLGYFAVVTLFLLGVVHVPESYKEVFGALIVFCTAQLGQIISYFFSRQRVSTPGATT